MPDKSSTVTRTDTLIVCLVSVFLKHPFNSLSFVCVPLSKFHSFIFLVVMLPHLHTSTLHISTLHIFTPQIYTPHSTPHHHSTHLHISTLHTSNLHTTLHTTSPHLISTSHLLTYLHTPHISTPCCHISLPHLFHTSSSTPHTFTTLDNRDRVRLKTAGSGVQGGGGDYINASFVDVSLLWILMFPW